MTGDVLMKPVPRQADTATGSGRSNPFDPGREFGPRYTLENLESTGYRSVRTAFLPDRRPQKFMYDGTRETPPARAEGDSRTGGDDFRMTCMVFSPTPDGKGMEVSKTSMPWPLRQKVVRASDDQELKVVDFSGAELIERTIAGPKDFDARAARYFGLIRDASDRAK